MTAELYRLALRGVMTKGRLFGLTLFGVLGVVNSAIVRANCQGCVPSFGLSFADNYGVGLLAPVISLVVAAAAFGDHADDKTLVYIWLRPVERWRTVGAFLAATLTVVLPLVVVPAAAIGFLSGGGARLAVAGAVSSSLAAVAYASLFLGLGLKVRRALAWGMAYVLIWEGAVARAARGAARLSIQNYARSVLYPMAGGSPPRIHVGVTVGVIVPLVVAVAAVLLTTRWLSRSEVA